jgi:hypothetical protein
MFDTLLASGRAQSIRTALWIAAMDLQLLYPQLAPADTSIAEYPVKSNICGKSVLEGKKLCSTGGVEA